ncbi:MAG: rRNA maturation RNase YbeY [Pseudomonadales bacterium]
MMPVELQISDELGALSLPSEQQFGRWVEHALVQVNRADSIAQQDVCIRVTGAAESQRLNRQYRRLDKPTNVLSFPAQLAETAALLDETELLPLGDLVISWPTVVAEAEAQDKLPDHHLAHLVVHGTLHLLGYDHESDADAEVMEAIEVAALAEAGIANPYRVVEGDHA